MSQPSLPRNYWTQWSASLISNLGDGINFVAMPLLALSLTADERILSLTTFATFVPWIALALPIGTVVDRVDRQRLMVLANVVRIALFAVVAIGAAGGWLSIWLLLAVLVVVGSFEVMFDSSAQAFLPMLVEPAQLPRANGLLFAAEVVAGSIVGLSVGAALFDVSIGLPFWFNAASFAIAAALIVSIRRPRDHQTGPVAPIFDTSLRAGMRWLFDHPLLRVLALMFTVTNLGLMFGQGIFVKYAIERLGLSSTEFGLLLAITAMGAALGGVLGPRAIDRVGFRSAIVVAYLVFGVAHFVIGIAPAAWIVAIAGFTLGAAITVWNIITVSVRQRVIPTDRFGRVNAVYRWLGATASAIGVAAGGFVAYLTNLTAPFLIGGGITLVAAAFFGKPVLTALESIDAVD